MPKTLEFFYDFTSVYSYLASTQMEALGQRTGAQIRWRPFLLGAVFKATQNVPPFTVAPKAQYLFKDVNDWARHYGLPPFVLPEGFPMNSILALRVALALEEQGLQLPYVRRVFNTLYVEGQEATTKERVVALLGELGLAADALLARAESQAIKDQLRANTDEAVARGAFGAPTFYVGEDMYVGNDRLSFVERALQRV